MPLPSGSRIGSFVVDRPIGRGGFGEVYLARDTRLDRSVAIKALPSTDPDSRARFEREAKAVAGLQHPHICTLFDVVREGGVDYLVLEYLEGETLAARLERGPLPLDDAIKVAVEISGALDAAHRTGIVHRDLKPANVMLTQTGVKLLDFGLAKANQSAPISGLTAAATRASPPLTGAGSVVGTLQYMSPEQLEGRPSDQRADIWALGCITYEMVTGRRAFAGESPASVISAIIAGAPAPIASVTGVAPPELGRVVATCLAKDPDARFSSAHDVAINLGWISSPPDAPASIVPSAKSTRLAWTAAAVLAIAAASVTYAWLWRPPSSASRTLSTIELPDPSTTDLALSPDETMLAIAAGPPGRERLFVRRLDTMSARELAGTDGATSPFWSPDSHSIGFFADGKLKRIRVDGGSAIVLCSAPIGRGGTWNAEGTIVFGPDLQSPLFRVSADGGSPTPVTTLDAHEPLAHQFPRFLPDGRRFLYSVGIAQGVRLGSLDGTTGTTSLKTDGTPLVLPSGLAVFTRGGTLTAQSFDLRTFALSGQPRVIAEHVGPRLFTAASELLVYREAPRTTVSASLVDRDGKKLQDIPWPLASGFALSHNDAQIADVEAGDLWTIDLRRGTRTRVEQQQSVDCEYPTWSPDDSRVGCDRYDASGLRILAIDGTSDPEEVYRTPPGTPHVLLWDWTRDNRYLIFGVNNPRTTWDVWALPLNDRQKPIPVAQLAGIQVHAQVSPDGRWVAYSSNDSGQYEVYVQSFPTGRRWQISNDGGAQPQWRRDGQELFYLSGSGHITAVPVKSGATFEAGTAAALFGMSAPGGPFSVSRHHFQPTSDGRRFIVRNAATANPNSPIVLAHNWSAIADRR